MRPSPLLLLLLCSTATALEPAPSMVALPTGNGFGFQLYDLAERKITAFLEHPYRYLRAGIDPQQEGVRRRNLCYDAYLGLRVGDHGVWLKDVPSQTGYLEQTSTLRSVATVDGVLAESLFFSPFGYSGNAMVMMVRLTNQTDKPLGLDAFANPNFHLGRVVPPGSEPPDLPSADGESIAFGEASAIETGPGGGAMIYQPIGRFDRADCAGSGYANVLSGRDLDDGPRSCKKNDATLLWQRSFGEVAPHAQVSFGLVIQFVADPSRALAAIAAWSEFAQERSPDALLAAVQNEWELWRKPPPFAIGQEEARVYRMQETVLRMAQVLEPYSENPKAKSYGMILASLPPGEWHIGWVRDAAYAIVALAKMGHFEEAKRGLQFFLDAEAGRYQSYTGVPYRISVVRYFGDGTEESDHNADGPNIELDGWGLYLWAARQYLESSGDRGWLSEKTRAGQTVGDVLYSEVALPIEHNIDSLGLTAPDTSIWEVHWNRRKHHTYSSLAAARGLCDLAALSEDKEVSVRLAKRSRSIAEAVRSQMVTSTLVLAGSLEGITSGHLHDGAVVEAFNWDLFPKEDPITSATLASLETLRTPVGGYHRNDDALSDYDSSEWAMIDLRASAALRRSGETIAADALTNWVTASAIANHHLIPELYNRFDKNGPLGGYAGAMPMVGFGAGAYVLGLFAGSSGEPHDCGKADATLRDDPSPSQPSVAGCSYAAVVHPASVGRMLLFLLVLLLLRSRRV